MDIRPLAERDLAEADRIFRIAFGTFIGLPDPESFAGDSDYVHTRWKAAPHAAFGAYENNQLIGSNFLTRWGSFGFFGPLTVRPDYWDKGVARKLLDVTMQSFEQWGVKELGLFTFPHSTKHVGLYQKYGFWPQCLTAVMAKPIQKTGRAPARIEASLDACRALTDSIQPGLDLGAEITALKTQNLGILVAIEDGKGLSGFAIVHVGAGTEAGSGTAYVKFAASRPGDPAAFERLLDAIEDAAAERSAENLVAGVNTARAPAYRALIERGFKTAVLGVAMQKDGQAGSNRPDCFVLDDWR